MRPTAWMRWSDDALVEEFRRARQEAYLALARGDRACALERLNATRRPTRHARLRRCARLVEVFRGRLSALERIDFFGSAGRDRVVSLMAHLEERARRRVKRRRAPRQRPATDVTSYTRTPVGDPPPSRRGPHELGVADQALRRSRRAIRVRRRPGLAARSNAMPVRHVRRRVHSPGRTLHVRDAVRAPSASRIRLWPALPRSSTTST